MLAAGDYGSSKEKRTQYFDFGYGNIEIRGSRCNTGEVIDSAIDIGARSEGEWGDAHMAIIDVGSPDIGGYHSYRWVSVRIILNHAGQRFVDEGEDSRAHTYAKFGQRIFEQPYHEAFIILELKIVEDVAHMGPSRAITADSIDALVRRLDIEDPEQAVETVEAYKQACDSGAADRYDPNILDGNPAQNVNPPKSNWALPLDEPPYTGYPVTEG